MQEALLGRQGVRLESEQLQRKSGTSGRNPYVVLVLLHSILKFLFFFLVSLCRQKEKEQMEMLKNHHEEEIDHHRKEIERLQKEIDRHRGKIRKLKHDD